MDNFLSPKFLDALDYSFNSHKAQPRKGTKIPYIAHLLAVCAIVLEHGGEEEHAIAALLHDAAEDEVVRLSFAKLNCDSGKGWPES
jgi:(p)ppGpp synthase/HD superfamily hydrolase